MIARNIYFCFCKQSIIGSYCQKKCWFGTVIQGKKFWLIASLKELKNNVQTERGYHEETSLADTRFHSEELAQTHLHQKVLVQVSILFRGHVVLSLLLLPKLRSKKKAGGRRCCLCQEEMQMGRGGIWVTISISHGPEIPALHLAGTWLHKSCALNLFLILCLVTSKGWDLPKQWNMGLSHKAKPPLNVNGIDSIAFPGWGSCPWFSRCF